MSRNYSSNQYAVSRRNKQEEKKLTHQFVLLVLLAIGLVLLFLFVVLPALIRILASTSPTPSQNGADVPVQVPFLSAPVTATSSATLTLSGFSQKGFTVSILDNAQPLSKTSASDDGSFHTDVTLTPGENKITVFAIDQHNKESGVSQEYIVVFDDQPPTLELKQPQDKQSIQGKQNQNLTIEGKTDTNTKVYVNDRLIFVKDDGSFTGVQPLQEGDNALSIKAVDQAGNITEKKLTITFHQ